MSETIPTLSASATAPSLVGVAQELDNGSKGLTGDGKREDKRWSNLPKDLVAFILRYVHYSRLYGIRATCISWGSCCPYFTSPLLFYTTYQTYNSFDPLYNTTRRIPGSESYDRIVYSFSHGWLLLGVRGADTLFFLDPTLQLEIRIADKPSNMAFDKICFSSPPTSSDCFIIGVSTFFRRAKIGVLKYGKASWVVKTLESAPFYSDPIFYDGRCYCLDNRGRLVVFNPRDIRNSCWTSNQLLVPRMHRCKPPQGFLVEGNGELFSVFVDINHSERPVCVYKLDISKNMFEKVENLGQRTIYVSHKTSILTTSTIRGTGNKIYFPTFHRKNVVFYSLATKKYYAYGDDLCETPLSLQKEECKDFMFAAWFLPPESSSSSKSLEKQECKDFYVF